MKEGMRRLAQAARTAACVQSNRLPVERRRRSRTYVAKLLTATPVLADGLTPVGDPFPVLSRYVSRGGLDFFSQDAIPYRYVQFALDGDSPLEQVLLVARLHWCRFSASKFYENGGIFVKQFISSCDV